MGNFSKLKELFKITETMGFSQEEITSAIEKFNSLPKILIQYYQEMGKHEILNHAQNNLLSPNELVEIGDYVIFYTENQYVAQWGISKKDLFKENPPVYVTYDEETFLKETETLSDFLISSGYLHACFGLEFSTEELIEIKDLVNY